MVALERADIVAALRDLADELRADGGSARVRLVGGAALALRYFDRQSTSDLDAVAVGAADDKAVAAAAARVAARRSWPPNWLNFETERLGAVPWLGRPAEWVSVFDEAGIVVEVASAETLLAMKLRAGRPGRDVDDIRQLLRLCGISRIEDAEELYEGFYPGETFSHRTQAIVAAILSEPWVLAERPQDE